jgi:hypothetical protein
MNGLSAHAEQELMAVGFPKPGPEDSWSHDEIEDSSLTDEEIRAACEKRLEKIKESLPEIEAAIAEEDREGRTRILANLNAGTTYVQDFFGC